MLVKFLANDVKKSPVQARWRASVTYLPGFEFQFLSIEECWYWAPFLRFLESIFINILFGEQVEITWFTARSPPFSEKGLSELHRERDEKCKLEEWMHRLVHRIDYQIWSVLSKTYREQSFWLEVTNERSRCCLAFTTPSVIDEEIFEIILNLVDTNLMGLKGFRSGNRRWYAPCDRGL